MPNLNAIQRLLGTAAALTVCACALPASAQQAQQQSQEASAPAPAPDAQTISRDPATGKLRAATPEEQAALAALKSTARARIAPQPMLRKFHSSGAGGIELNEEAMTSVVAVRTADGKIQMVCEDAHGGAPNAAHVHAAPNTPVTE
jgi:hypothetical protein